MNNKTIVIIPTYNEIENISRIIDLPIDKISVKATTSEGLGIIGKDMAMACKTIVLLKKK